MRITWKEKYTKEQQLNIVNLYENGVGFRELMKEFHTGKTVIYNILTAYNVKIRRTRRLKNEIPIIEINEDDNNNTRRTNEILPAGHPISWGAITIRNTPWPK